VSRIRKERKRATATAKAQLGATGGRWEWLIPIVLVLAAVCAYSNSLAGPFVYDDLSAIRDNPHIRQLWPIGEALSAPAKTTVTGRPVVALSLAVNYALSGLAVGGYHVFNLGVHIFVALLLYGLVRRSLLVATFRGPGSEWAKTGPMWLAASVALLWELHPLATEAVDYVVQRTELLASLFLLLTLYGLIRGSSSSRRWLWYSAAIVSCALGMGSKEMMAGAPLIALLYDRAFLSASWREVWDKRGRVHLSLAGTWLVLLALVAAGGRAETVGFSFHDVGPWDYAKTQFGVILHYLRLCVWPYPLCLDYADWPVAASVSQVLPAAAVVLALLCVTIWALVRKPAMGFVGACFFIILAPSSSVVPIVTEFVAERRMYLPLAAVVTLIVVAVAWLIRRLPGRLPRPAMACVLVLGYAGMLGAVTFARNEDYQSDLAVWNDVVAKRPGNARAHNNLGTALVRAGRLGEAMPHFSKAVALAPEYPDALSNLGVMFDRKNRPADAIVWYRKALKVTPGLTDARYNLALALHRTEQIDEAEREYREVIRLAPEHVAAHNNLGLLLADRGRFQEAADQLKEALRLDPENAAIRRTLDAVEEELGKR
jgi:protein O-mannosyl-transferase